MAITYDAPSNTITVVGGPYNFTDVYNADQAGGWGVIIRSTMSYGAGWWYKMDSKLTIGDGSTITVFTDSKVMLTLDNYIGNVILVKTAATLTFTAVAIYSVNYGMVISRSGSGIINLYDCGITTYWSGSEGGIQADVVVRCNFYGGTALTLCQNATVNRLNIVASGTGNFPISYSYGTFDDIVVRDSNYALLIFNIPADTVIKDLQSINNTYDFYVGDWHANFYLINPIANWHFYWGGSSNVDGKVYRQYTFDLNVTDKNNNAISGATVALKDKNGTTVFSVATNASGDIATQTVSRGYYDQAHGDTLQDYSPHTLTISKAGFQTYTEVFTLDAQVVWKIQLQRIVQIFFDNGKPILNLKPTDPINKFVITL